MRDLLSKVMTGSMVAGAALLVAACGGGEDAAANNTATNYVEDPLMGANDVTPVDAEATPTSAVYHEPGFELEAARMAVDLGWDPLALAPMAEIPTLTTDRTFELVALVGLDES